MFNFLTKCSIFELNEEFDNSSECIIKGGINMEENVLFKNVDDLISYLYHRFPEQTPLSPLKLQKMLYFLFAYYGAAMVDTDMSSTLPKYLFMENFEAWKYGPVIKEVYQKNKEGYYSNIQSFDSSEINDELLSFIDEMFVQINEISDFSLVQRSHLDKAWKEKFDKEDDYHGNQMSKDQIIEEYSVNG